MPCGQLRASALGSPVAPSASRPKEPSLHSRPVWFLPLPERTATPRAARKPPHSLSHLCGPDTSGSGARRHGVTRWGSRGRLWVTLFPSASRVLAESSGEGGTEVPTPLLAVLWGPLSGPRRWTPHLRARRCVPGPSLVQDLSDAPASGFRAPLPRPARVTIAGACPPSASYPDRSCKVPVPRHSSWSQVLGSRHGCLGVSLTHQPPV